MSLRNALIVLTLLAGCASPPAPEANAPAVPAGFPAALYRQAEAKGAPVYMVNAGGSRVQIRVYRGGPLARFGHDHVISSRSVQGYVQQGPGRARADLYLPLNSLTVDDEVLSPSDAAATRRNMLDKVLEAFRYPFAVVHAECDLPCAVLEANVTLHGVTRAMPIPVEWRVEGARLEASGSVRLRHEDFGLVPYRLLGGALRVEEAMDLSFSIEAGKGKADAGAAVGN